MKFFDSRRGAELRDHVGRLLTESTDVAFAMRRIRLARLDLSPRELRQVARCRVLLGRLDAEALAGSAAEDASVRTAALLDMAASGRLEVRAAGLITWEPDFSLFTRPDGTSTLLFGCHQFGPQSVESLVMACAVDDAATIRSARMRFNELWERGHDALEAVTSALCRTAPLA